MLHSKFYIDKQYSLKTASLAFVFLTRCLHPFKNSTALTFPFSSPLRLAVSTRSWQAWTEQPLRSTSAREAPSGAPVSFLTCFNVLDCEDGAGSGAGGSVNCFNFNKSRRWAKLISKLDSVNTIPRVCFRTHAYTPS